MTMIMAPLPAKGGSAPKPAAPGPERARGPAVERPVAAERPVERAAERLVENTVEKTQEPGANGSEREDTDAEA